MEYEIVQLKAFDLICLKRHIADRGEVGPMWEVFNENNYLDILSKYNPYPNGNDPLGATSETKIYRYAATLYNNKSSFNYCIGTAYNGKGFSHENSNLAEAVEIVKFPRGTYVKLVMPPSYENPEDFIKDLWKNFLHSNWGYEPSGKRELVLANTDNPKDWVTYISVKKKKPDPPIEEQIKNKLSGDMQKNALDFIAYMKAAGMTTHDTYSTAFEYNGKWVCILIIGKNNWTIYDNPLTKHYDDFPVDESMKEFVCAHVRKCTKCGCDSSPGINKLIFGRAFENVCTSEVGFRNPDVETLQKVRQMIDIWKKNIDGGNE